jgi:hypothetical protein
LPERPIRDQELVELSARLYEQVGQRDVAHGMSQGTARQLVRDYGEEAVEKALTLLRTRKNVHNAAGFVITVLRSEHQGQHGSKPRPADLKSHAAWLARLKESPYLDFYENLCDTSQK